MCIYVCRSLCEYACVHRSWSSEAGASRSGSLADNGGAGVLVCMYVGHCMHMHVFTEVGHLKQEHRVVAHLLTMAE